MGKYPQENTMDGSETYIECTENNMLKHNNAVALSLEMESLLGMESQIVASWHIDTMQTFKEW